MVAIKYLKTEAIPTNISRWVDRNVNTVTLIMERMAKKGLIIRFPDMNDRRSFHVIMTEKGQEYLKKNARKSSALIRKLLENLSDDELRTLSTLLEKIRRQAINCYRKEKILMKYHLGKPANDSVR